LSLSLREPGTAGLSARRAVHHARDVKIARPAMDRLHDYVHFAPENRTNPLLDYSVFKGSMTGSREEMHQNKETGTPFMTTERALATVQQYLRGLPVSSRIEGNEGIK
jgi:hypothetical protein